MHDAAERGLVGLNGKPNGQRVVKAAFTQSRRDRNRRQHALSGNTAAREAAFAALFGRTVL